MRCDDVLELQSALLDGELSARDSRDLQAHVATCTHCQARLEDLQELSGSLRGQAEYFRAPAALRSRIAAQIRAEVRAPTRAAQPARSALSFSPPSWWPRWGMSVAVPVAAALLSFTIGVQFAGPSADDRLLEEAVGSHARALLTDHAFDVASSDQHTVKPWFAGKVDFSPPVRDLSADGFPLIGGRLDVLNHTRVAVLAYRRRQHEIDVFVWPVEAGASGLSGSTRTSRGYNVVRWNEGGMNFCAVSDVSMDDLQHLMALIRTTSTS
jgi:anti-sigma factor (TIGR02949 family)